jgi:hypothetical protein
MGMGGRRLFVSAIAAFVGLLAAAPAAQASFHLMKVREVYAGASDDSYVELQMLFNTEFAVGGHSLRLYNAAGATLDTFTFTVGYQAPNHNSASGNNTILIGDTGVQTAFGVTPDDHTEANLNIPASGGAVCWLDGSPPDCVSWGNFTGSASLPAPGAGTPVSAGGITAGKALRRSIAPGCSTLLESGDDTDNSATDFSEVTPNPRNNASTVTESMCAPPPTAVIDTKPPSSTNSTSASFTFHSSPAGATFQCKLDADPFAACDSGSVSYPGPLSEASHTFQVKATNGNGTGAAASYTWKVDLTAPTASITTKPADPSAPPASFKYSSNEINSTFQCKLTPLEGTFSSCNSQPKTYSTLVNGQYTFEVFATDSAGNPQASPTSYSWMVDNSLKDITPPETFINSKPPDPSNSSEATFTYSSGEANSTFQCKLDGAAFASCGSSGITYTGLTDGSHTFQVKATDSSNNTDASPAGYTFSVALPSGTPPPPPTLTPPPLLPPQTTISLKPPAKTHDRTPTFRFRSSEAGSTYRCKVDKGAFKACRSPFTTKTLTFGRHTLKIQAVFAGVVDPTPATFSFKVVKH